MLWKIVTRLKVISLSGQREKKYSKNETKRNWDHEVVPQKGGNIGFLINYMFKIGIERSRNMQHKLANIDAFLKLQATVASSHEMVYKVSFFWKVINPSRKYWLP